MGEKIIYHILISCLLAFPVFAERTVAGSGDVPPPDKADLQIIADMEYLELMELVKDLDLIKDLDFVIEEDQMKRINNIFIVSVFIMTLFACPGAFAEPPSEAAVEKWQQMSEAERDQLRRQYKVWSSLSAEEKAEIRKRVQHLISCPMMSVKR